MKFSAIPIVFITSVILLVLTIMVVMNVSFSWVFYLTCLGQLMVIIMVYKVLRDTYTTTKTFKDFYEDYPISDHT
ncbi:hypothetical protein U6A24_06175 [Aquimarina gracilis]|uniref:Uncharacterized protein n=1 Tax=Aquimarina gracilis TaxID=874422 RepID=A0ABU5ZUH6_9FLAO|nr:hypothetical protein [Aquimarina gracilis]MEB3345037.1 hypothetical protein [Aquimarina gracilis]